MVLTPAARDLIWVEWDDAYSVYQPSSTETHVFNETTALIVEALQAGPLELEGVAESVAQALGLAKDELAYPELESAAARLEELGLVEWPERALAAA
jgi:PqqD family protein of HPr-rel-A system